jgi:DNA-directed RNA polymerase subunit RPC12/RpoP
MRFGPTEKINMPRISSYECNACGLTVASSVFDGMVAIDDQGARVPCLHPGEFSTAAEVLGISIEELDGAFAQRRSRVKHGAHGEHGEQTSTSERERLVNELVSSRIRYSVGCFCFDCGARTEIDTPATEKRCSECGSTSIFSSVDSVGRACPKCRTGTIESRDTGIHF